MSQPEPTPSLIQQRFALRRERNLAVWMTVGPLVAGSMLLVTRFVEGTAGWFHWLGVVVFIGSAVYGAVKLLAARRATREFETRYGRDAGIQD